MDDEDILEWQELIIVKKRRRRVLRKKAAIYGLNCPAEIETEIEDITRDIRDLEQKIRRKINNVNSDGILYSAEDANEIYDRTADIASRKIRTGFLEGFIKILKSLFYWRKQDLTLKVFTILVVLFTLNSIVQVSSLASSLLDVDRYSRIIITVVLAFIVSALWFIYYRKKLIEARNVIGELEAELEEDMEELQFQKEQLDKIYKVAE